MKSLFKQQNAVLCEGNSVVECQLPKLNVAGSIPVPRLKFFQQNLLVSACFIAGVLFFISGCATVDHPAPGQESTSPSSSPEGELPNVEGGVYHKVKPGETLWRIAKTYNVDVDNIVQRNNIPNAGKIEKDQLIFIPGAVSTREVSIDEAPAIDDGTFVWPVKGRVLVHFGERYRSRITKGLLIETREGTQVKAARSGKVVFADYLNGYAHTVILEHTDGFNSVYGQNAKLTVRVGDQVAQNEPVGYVGCSGNDCFAYFEVRKKGASVNPVYYLP